MLEKRNQRIINPLFVAKYQYEGSEHSLSTTKSRSEDQFQDRRVDMDIGKQRITIVDPFFTKCSLTSASSLKSPTRIRKAGSKRDWRPRDREIRGYTSNRSVQSEKDQTPKIGGTPTQHFASGLRYSTNSCNRADRLRTPQSPHSAREAPRKDSQLIR